MFSIKRCSERFVKKETPAHAFLVNFGNFWNSFFYSFFHFWVTASGAFSKDIEKSAGS